MPSVTQIRVRYKDTDTMSVAALGREEHSGAELAATSRHVSANEREKTRGRWDSRGQSSRGGPIVASTSWWFSTEFSTRRVHDAVV
jgi:hypothetical protein